MQHNLITTMRSLKIVDGCKSAAQVYSALNTSLNPCAGTGEDKLQQDPYRANSLRFKSMQSTSLSELLSAYGIPVADLIEPQIEPYLKSVDFSQTLADIYRRLEAASQCEKSLVHLEQASFFRGLSDPKLLRRSLRCARQHAIDVHSKVVLAAWLRFERREDELVGSSSMDCGVGRILECPKSSLVHGYDPGSVYDPCPCRQPAKNEESSSPAETASVDVEEGGGGGGEDEGKELEVVGEGELEEEMAPSTSAEECDVSFCIGDDEVKCIRYNIASLSRPLMTMLYGGFAESRREMVNFSNIGISVKGMEAIEAYSRTNKLDSVTPQIVLELLYFADKFCCDELKSACDAYLASLVYNIDDAFKLIEYGLEETAYLLVASCLQVFLRELPGCLYKSEVMKYFCEPEARKRLDEAGNASFTLYYFLSQVAMEEDMKSNTTVMLLERLGECAAEGWQKALALHQLGCVMLERQEYKDAQHWFEASAQSGHVYSLVGVARSKFKRGHKYLAYKQMNSLISEYKPIGWMYQERSLYCNRKEKMMDLHSASSMDPTLLYPYKYRACLMVEEHKIGAAISEISKIIGFRVSPDCLELRAWCSILLEDYEGALRDIRALLTLDPNYMVFHGKVHGDHIVDLIRKNVEHERTGPADCWIQLYDRWSSVDDIGSLAVVHQMLAYDPCKSLLRFRQSLLLLRLNCQKAAMRSLRLARNHSNSEHERLVYEGWILYDTGHREEALAKAEESISIQRSFEAYFLKAYALADTSLDADASAYVIQLLQQALKCASDGLRKGQALNNLGSVYVDCEKLDLAEDCYRNALNIRHTRAHQGLARVYHLKNNKKCAYDEMTKLIEKARNNASAYEKRSEYCERDMARSDLTMATQLDPLRTYPYRYRAAVLMDDHKEAEAIAELSKAILFKPDLQLLQLRAAFYESIGDTTSTVRDCEAALCIDPNHMETLDLYNKARDQVLTPQPKK